MSTSYMGLIMQPRTIIEDNLSFEIATIFHDEQYEIFGYVTERLVKSYNDLSHLWDFNYVTTLAACNTNMTSEFRTVAASFSIGAPNAI